MRNLLVDLEFYVAGFLTLLYMNETSMVINVNWDEANEIQSVENASMIHHCRILKLLIWSSNLDNTNIILIRKL